MIEVKPPKVQTLKRYGITQEEWLALLKEQGGVCPICKKVPENGRLVTDHEHVRGFKKMPTCSRKTYVRGVCCLRCNLMYLPVGITIEKAKNIVTYLERYLERQRQNDLKSMPSSVLEGKKE
jgi:hypothetical protein